MNKRAHSGPSSGTRPKRIAGEIQRDLPEMIRRHVALPEGVLVSITDVRLSPDLSHAKIFYSVLGGDETKTAAYVGKLLNAKRGVFRTEIAKVLVMRQHPELHFEHDEVPARAAHIETLLKQVREERESREGGEN